ncbi:MAG: hypothetical protein WC356_02410 [Candidatus Micrarchaeia archaeon]|jgi:hypothetical protein
MIKIPDKINIMGHTYDVVFDPILSAERDCSGEIHYRTQKIALQPDVTGDPRHREAIEYSFFHEFVHGVLHSIRHELQNDEVFVSNFARVLYQSLRDAGMLVGDKVTT